MSALPPPTQQRQPRQSPSSRSQMLLLFVPYVLAVTASPYLGLLVSLAMFMPVYLQINVMPGPRLKDFLMSKLLKYSFTWLAASLAALFIVLDQELVVLLGLSYIILLMYLLRLKDAPIAILDVFNGVIFGACVVLIIFLGVMALMDQAGIVRYLVTINCLVVVVAEATLFQIRYGSWFSKTIILTSLFISTSLNIFLILLGNPELYLASLILYLFPLGLCIASVLSWYLYQK